MIWRDLLDFFYHLAIPGLFALGFYLGYRFLNKHRR